ncbi:hypothetical protein KSD_72630 [Ktedonobacter sp. SOSP1-85]|uniref:hypothetical protein n=1 Tax=Ktedonobacter sp. SOSP1-85 TaxID=2778367 RepID=UPI001915EFA7|nr:hypothetical protein [Ktedonobacter sp. SOSP1-85]GHO79492.1 hypothetical protein KSD_72630 [Ktedonobacter sp. SOSP1-85]
MCLLLSSVILVGVVLHPYNEDNGALFGGNLIETPGGKEYFVALLPVVYQVIR